MPNEKGNECSYHAREWWKSIQPGCSAAGIPSAQGRRSTKSIRQCGPEAGEEAGSQGEWQTPGAARVCTHSSRTARGVIDTGPHAAGQEVPGVCPRMNCYWNRERQAGEPAEPAGAVGLQHAAPAAAHTEKGETTGRSAYVQGRIDKRFPKG